MFGDLQIFDLKTIVDLQILSYHIIGDLQIIKYRATDNLLCSEEKHTRC